MSCSAVLCGHGVGTRSEHPAARPAARLPYLPLTYPALTTLHLCPPHRYDPMTLNSKPILCPPHHYDPKP